MPQITVSNLPQNRKECIIVFSAEEVAPVEEKFLRQRGSNVNVPGFRPGNAPIDILRDKVDPSAVLEDTVRELLPAAVEQAANEHSIDPIARPAIEVKEHDPLTVRVVFVLQPEVKVKKPKVELSKKEPEVDDKDIKRVIDSTIKQHQVMTEVERASKDTDRLVLDFWGEDADGNEVQGTRTTEREVIIGSKTLIPGFEDELIGLKTKDEKSFTITFPDNYHNEDLRNAPVTFHVTVQKVEEVQTPEWNDAFAKEHLMVDTTEEYEKIVRQTLLEQEQRAFQSSQEQKVLDAVVKATTVDLAEELLVEEERSLMNQFQEQLQQQGMTFEQWMQVSGKKPEEVQADFKKQCEQRLKLRFGMEQLIKERDITVSDEEINALVEKKAEGNPPEQADQIRQAYQLPEYRQDIEWHGKVEKLIAELMK